MIRVLTALILTVFLSGCFIFGEPTEFDETTGQSPQWIMNKADGFAESRDWRKVIDFLEKLVKRFPDSKVTPQARLSLSYAYYKFGQKELAQQTLDQFIRIYPSHPAMDYAYYLKGLTQYEERGILNKLTFQDISDRDVNALKTSFSTFKDLTKKYPNSKYYQDSVDRMTYLMNKIAEYELHVARFYMKRKAFVAAVNRAQKVITDYPESAHVEESLIIEYLAYQELGIKDLAGDTLKIIKLNYPENPIINNYVDKKKEWWKFWESLTD